MLRLEDEMVEQFSDDTLVMCELLRREERRSMGATVDALASGDAHGCGTYMSASSVRRALGHLYGVGQVQVIGMDGIAPLWATTTPELRKSL